MNKYIIIAIIAMAVLILILMGLLIFFIFNLRGREVKILIQERMEVESLKVQVAEREKEIAHLKRGFERFKAEVEKERKDIGYSQN